MEEKKDYMRGLVPYKKGEAKGRPVGTKNKKTRMMEELVYQEIMKRGMIEKYIGYINDGLDDGTIKHDAATNWFNKVVAPWFMPDPNKTIEDSINEIDSPEAAANAVELLKERLAQMVEKDDSPEADPKKITDVMQFLKDKNK